MELTPSKIELLATAGVIIFGAIVHATSQLKVARDKKSAFTIIDFIILLVIATFSGMIFGLVSTLFSASIIRLILSSAVGAFLGMAGLNKIANIVLDIITSRVNPLSPAQKKDETK